jgi:hypothetical protein
MCPSYQSAFDMFDINLLIKRSKIIGLPSDVISLIEIWLKERMCSVSKERVKNFMLYDLLLGTNQVSILGPILYALFA